MKINRDTSFPYPVLGHRKGISSSADASLEGKIVNDDYIWDIIISHDNEDIERLVQSGKVKYACEVECQETYYRNAFYPKIGDDAKHIQVKINKEDIGGRVNIAVTALAVEKLPEYHNSKSSGIYSNYNFDLEPGDILATFGEWDIDLDIEATSYKRITSIVQLQLVDTPEIEIELEDKKAIIIQLPKSKYQAYIDKLKNPFYQPALLSSIVFEAICKAIFQLKDHTESTWGRVLESKLKKDYGYGDDAAEQVAGDLDSAFELTRKMLEDPYCQLYSLLTDINSNRDSDDNEIIA